jgi:hypothetical protein
MNLMNLFEALKEPKFVPSKQALDLAAHLLKRLFQNEEKNESAEISQELIIVENQKVLTRVGIHFKTSQRSSKRIRQL